MIAHNEDGPPELDAHCRWLTVSQENGTNFSTFHYPGMLPGHTFSVNSHGLLQTINNIRIDDLKSGLMTSNPEFPVISFVEPFWIAAAWKKLS